MKKVAIFAMTLVGLLFIQQIVYMTPAYENLLEYFAHHSVRFACYRAFWIFVKLLLIFCLGLVAYLYRKELPKLHTGHKWLTLILAIAYTIPIIWSAVERAYTMNGIVLCYANNYYHLCLLVLLFVWLAFFMRTHYEHFCSELLGVIGILGSYSAAMLILLGAYTLFVFISRHVIGGCSIEALVSWLVPAFPALTAWIYWALNMRK